MKQIWRALFCAATCAALALPVALSRPAAIPVAAVAPADDSPRSPVTFEENRGQFDSGLRYAARGSQASTYITSRGALLVALRPAAPDRTAAVMGLTPIGGNPAPKVHAIEPAPGRVHVFRGNDPRKWVRDIPTSRRVRVRDLYAGIDVEYYGTGEHLEYDVIVAPGGDASAIRLRADNATIRRGADGALVFQTPAADVVQRRPVAYQDWPEGRRDVSAAYEISGSDITFAVGDYDHTRPLVIDPVLLVSTYLGGSGVEGDVKIAYGPSGLYMTGTTASTDLPTTNALFSDNGAEDVFVAKFNSLGTTLESLTYLGGSGADTSGGIAVDAAGRVYVAGTTASTDFPTANVVQPAFGGGATDAFVAAFNQDLSAMLFATYLGDAAADSARDVAASADQVFVTGAGGGPATSTTLTTGPGFVAQLTSAGALVYRARLLAIPNAIAIDPGGAAYVAGATTASGLATPGAFQVTPGSSECGNRIQHVVCEDGFVTKILPGGETLGYSTYLRESVSQAVIARDSIWDIAVNAAGEAFVTGLTSSHTFPTFAGAYQTTCGAPGDCWQETAFVSRFNPAGSGLVFSTFLGPSIGHGYGGLAIALGPAGQVHVGGYTFSSRFPVVDSDQTRGSGVILKSGDGGLSWHAGGAGLEVNLSVGLSAGDVQTSASDASRIYETSRPARSSDGGASWVPIVAGTGAIAVSTSNPSLVFLSQYPLLSQPQLFRSFDGGTTTEPLAISSVQHIVTVPGEPGAVYAANSAGIHRSLNDGDTWTSSRVGLPVDSLSFASLSAERAAGTTTLFAIVFDAGVRTLFKSVDAGATWSLVTTPLTAVFAAAPHPDNPLEVFAGGRVGTAWAVYRSTDGGATWGAPLSVVPTDLIVDIEIAPTSPATAFVATLAGLYRSDDAGQHWSKTEGVYHGVEVSAADPSTVYTWGPLTSDGFLSTLAPDGSTLQFSTFVGGFLDDRVTSIAVSPAGLVAAGGVTRSTDFPRVRSVQTDSAGSADAFLQVSGESSVLQVATPVVDARVNASAFSVTGHALDLSATSGSGVDAVHVYAYSLSNPSQPPIFLGMATLGGSRPELANAYSAQFASGGFSLGPVSLSPGPYLLAVFAHSSVTGTFGAPVTRLFEAVSGLSVEIEAPADGPVNQTFTISGHALDLNASSGTGVDAVHVWAYPNPGSGAAPIFVGADYGRSRPDLAASLGSQFANSGFSMSATLTAGPYQLVAYARSTTTGRFDAFDVAQITVATSAAQIHFDSPMGPDVFSGFVVSGWAADAGAPSGTGIDAVHVWAYPNPGSGAAPEFLGATTTAQPRDDIAQLLGGRFRMTGFAVTTAPLAPGNYLVAVFARSTVTGRFDAVVTRSLTVRAPEPVVRITAPAAGANLGEFMLEGFAFDPTGSPAPGIDGIHVWVYRNFGSGAPPQFVNLAPYGTPSDPAVAHYGASWRNTGFNLYLFLGEGTHLIAAYAHSPTHGYVVDTVLVTVPPARPTIQVEQPVNGQGLSSPFVLSGWALDRGAPAGNGVRYLDVWAYPNPGSGQPATFRLVQVGQPRPDVAAAYGQQFLNSGFNAAVTLNPGVYDLAVYPHSDVAAASVAPVVLRITVQ